MEELSTYKLTELVHTIETELAVIKKDFENCKILKQHDLDSLEEATNLQAKEYARRLDFLNGEAERLREMQATYVTREMWETNHKAIEVKIDTTTKFMYMALGALLIIEVALRYLS
jgi:DNA-directed RNA polymerase